MHISNYSSLKREQVPWNLLKEDTIVNLLSNFYTIFSVHGLLTLKSYNSKTKVCFWFNVFQVFNLTNRLFYSTKIEPPVSGMWCGRAPSPKFVFRKNHKNHKETAEDSWDDGLLVLILDISSALDSPRNFEDRHRVRSVGLLHRLGHKQHCLLKWVSRTKSRIQILVVLQKTNNQYIQGCFLSEIMSCTLLDLANFVSSSLGCSLNTWQPYFLTLSRNEHLRFQNTHLNLESLQLLCPARESMGYSFPSSSILRDDF